MIVTIGNILMRNGSFFDVFLLQRWQARPGNVSIGNWRNVAGLIVLQSYFPLFARRVTEKKCSSAATTRTRLNMDKTQLIDINATSNLATTSSKKIWSISPLE